MVLKGITRILFKNKSENMMDSRKAVETQGRSNVVIGSGLAGLYTTYFLNKISGKHDKIIVIDPEVGGLTGTSA